MAKIQISGIDAYVKHFNELANKADAINAECLYDAAGYAADQVRAALESMPERPAHRTAEDHKHRLFGATPSEKRQIINNFGISRFDRIGSKITVRIGFHGMVDTPSKRWNNSVPTGYLMQAINDGTEFRNPTRTMNRTQKAIKQQVVGQMQMFLYKKTKELLEQ